MIWPKFSSVQCWTTLPVALSKVQNAVTRRSASDPR